MSSIKKLAYAVFFVFLCIAPIISFAQDGVVGRLIDVPNMENDNANHAMTEELREAFGNAGHIVFSQDEMVSAARTNGFSEKYWTSEQDIAKINEKVRHDAVIRTVYKKGKKKTTIVIYIYNAYTGELMAELERTLKKKGKLTKDDVKAIVRGVNQVSADIVPIEYQNEVVIKITSTPEGADIYRNGQIIGKTPYELTLPAVEGGSEEWTLSYPDREKVVQVVSLENSNSYNVNIVGQVEEAKRVGKAKGSTGRPVFLLGFNASPTIRSLDSSAQKGKPVSYTTQVFGTYSFDFDFFPLALATDNQYVAGLGLTTCIGFGFLNSKLSTADGAVHACKDNGDGTITCDTKYIRFNLDLIYRLLLQKKDGSANPDGMALDFLAGLNLARYTINNNPTYTGHDYTGLNLGVKFSTPVGLRNLRFQLGLIFDINLSQGSIGKLTKWGSLIEKSWGVNANAGFLYDIWKGIYAHVGYSMTYMYDDFGGVGCLDANCLIPREAESKDMYHEIMIGLGYMLY